MTGLKISIQSSEEEKLAIRGQLRARTWSKAQLYEEIQEWVTRVPRSISSEGKQTRHVRAVDRHHLAKGALTGVG
jgi:hypothetical protein